MLSSALDLGSELINYIVWLVRSISSGQMPF